MGLITSSVMRLMSASLSLTKSLSEIPVFDLTALAVSITRPAVVSDDLCLNL